MLENYSKVLTIEALTMIEMGRKDIYPAVNEYISELCAAVYRKEQYGAPVAADKEVIAKLSAANEAMYGKIGEIEKLLIDAKAYEDPVKCAKFFADKIIPVMQEMRAYADEMEMNTAKKYWPFPTYGDILFSV